MIDISSFNKSLKITWIKKYLDNNNKGKWKIFFDVELKRYGGQSFFSYNLNVRDTLSTITTSDTFLKELLGIWAEVNFEPKIISRDHFLDQQLWHNSLIKIANKTVFLKSWFLKGITRVKHLLGPNNTFLSLNDFCCKYEIDLRPLTFYVEKYYCFGLRPEISHFALPINYCFLLARYHIWLAKTKENQPNLAHFIRTLKSQYEIEIKSGDKKKWKPLAGYMKI